MIWCRGEIVPDDSLRVSVLDRAFEHGLGLFETLRTWDGHPTLLPRHLERLQSSALALGLPLDPCQLPDQNAVAGLRAAASLAPERAMGARDVRIRITLSGGPGNASSEPSLLWMTAGPLSPPLREPGAFITQCIQVADDDTLARHKTLNYWRKRIAHQQAIEHGSDEVLCVTSEQRVCEGTRSNIFLVVGQRLWTPALSEPLLPGVMRRTVLERAARIGIELCERAITVEDLCAADEAFLTSSGRGMLPIAGLMGRELPAPGPVTRQLWNEILPWLESGGTLA
jgi:branched-subunit amino acid aminotransferase/4-amino-4-deoxychorismate lyase